MTAPKITEAHINETVRAVQFWRPENSTLTICAVQLVNGFYVVGKSACAAAENFDEIEGRNIAYADAVEKVWELEGYKLRDHLFQQEKVNQEIDDMIENSEGLAVSSELLMATAPL